MSEAQLRGMLVTVKFALPLSLPESKIMDVASILENEAISTSWERGSKGWQLLWLTDFKPAAAKLAEKISRFSRIGVNDIKIADVVETDWLAQSYRQFPPFQIGPFFIHGSHFKDKPPTKTIALQIDAATAFGSGEHGTTRGCIEALLWLKEQTIKPKTILDMGTGSGILAIAAYKLWKKPTLAIDNDRESVRVACRHRKMNGLTADNMVCAFGDGYHTRRVKQGSFDLIIANILAAPLVEMAEDLAENLNSKGYAVLSGLLVEQEKTVLNAHKKFGLKLIRRIRRDGWSALILQKL